MLSLFDSDSESRLSAVSGLLFPTCSGTRNEYMERAYRDCGRRGPLQPGYGSRCRRRLEAGQCNFGLASRVHRYSGRRWRRRQTVNTNDTPVEISEISEQRFNAFVVWARGGGPTCADQGSCVAGDPTR